MMDVCLDNEGLKGKGNKREQHKKRLLRSRPPRN
jgi:hypothetical protein